MSTSTVSDKAVSSELVREVIAEQVMNLSQDFTRLGRSSFHRKTNARQLENALRVFSRQVAAMAMSKPHSSPDFRKENWRRDWANDVQEVVLQSGVEALIYETAEALNARFPRYIWCDARLICVSLSKIASYVAQVSCMIHSGLDPELLRY